ncbi:hypothetical protein I4U23_013832 [Adineta vaga]|nr:hypothetical protein I4U23_013832 [Adineta vaga]
MSITAKSLLDNLDNVAVVCAGIFAGTALYISIGEVPAMQQLGADIHWRFFPPMFKKAALYQTIVAWTSGAASIIHGTRINGAPFYRNLWIIAGSTFFAITPYTIFVMLPTNKIILNDNQDIASGKESQFSVTQKEDLLNKWAGLHLVRTVSSLASFGAMVFGLSRHTSLILGR